MVDPDNPPRWWTVAEANAVLDYVRSMAARAQAALAAAGSNGHGEGARAELTAVLSELEGDGIVLRDVVRGLVDFPARSPSGRGFWLCWLLDEDEVAWWHWPEDGFPGRTPLSQPPT